MNSYNLFKLISDVMENKTEALDKLHTKFNPLLNKYAVLFGIEKEELISEFDFIIVKIYNTKIKEDTKILKYIKIVFKNYKKFQKSEIINTLESENLSNEIDVVSDLFFDDLIKSFNENVKDILNLRFKNQYTYEEIANVYGVSRQYIYKKIKTSLSLLKETL